MRKKSSVLWGHIDLDYGNFPDEVIFEWEAEELVWIKDKWKSEE